MTLRQDLATSALTDLLFEEPGAARCLVAPDDSVLRVNAAWLRAAGVSLDDALGADVADLLPEARHAALDLRARARSGHRVALPRHVRTIDGRETWWEGSVAPVPMEDGTHRCMEERVPVAFENYYAPLGLWSDVTRAPDEQRRDRHLLPRRHRVEAR